MSISVFTANPDVEYTYRDNIGVTVLRYAGTAKEQRAQNHDISRRTYGWKMSKDKAEREAVDEFFRLRGQTVESFFIRDPKDNARTGVSLGTGVSGQTGFDLPSTGENSRDYPVATYTIYKGGTAITLITINVNTDGRRFTWQGGAPTTGVSGQIFTADYHYYRRVRLAEPFEWAALAPNYFAANPSLVEVPE